LNEKRFFAALLAVYLVSVPVIAQSPVPDSSSSHTKLYLGIGGAVAITAVMFQYDQEIYDAMHAWKMNNPAIKKISPVITDLGDGAFSGGLFGGFLGYGLIFKNEKAVQVGKIGIESFLFTGIAVQMLKHLCGRERPSDASRPGGFWHGPFAFFDKKRGSERGIAAFDAFPSGHTTTVVAAATTLADAYPEPWVGYTCYSLATLTAISRVMESTHWISDCFVAAFLGYYGTKLVEYWNYGDKGFAIVPMADERQYGMMLVVHL
jgi:membrane-associated phospholipid phosphatase